MRKRIALLAAVSMLAVTMPTAACLADTRLYRRGRNHVSDNRRGEL